MVLMALKVVSLLFLLSIPIFIVWAIRGDIKQDKLFEEEQKERIKKEFFMVSKYPTYYLEIHLKSGQTISEQPLSPKILMALKGERVFTSFELAHSRAEKIVLGETVLRHNCNIFSPSMVESVAVVQSDNGLQVNKG